MNTTQTTPAPSYLRERHGIWSWLITTDHRRIAILYLITINFFFLCGMAAVGIMRVEALQPGGELLAPEDFNRLFTLHGLFLVFFFLLPVLGAVLGGFLVPPIIGARNLAFPRLNLLGWYLFVAGGVALLWSTINGAADTGWSLSMPYSTHFSQVNLTPVIVGVMLAGISVGAMGLNLVVTVHTRRGPEMDWSKIPVFVWGQYCSGLVLAAVTPLLVGALIVLLFNVLDHGPISSNLAGDTHLYKVLFWSYAKPAMHAPLLAGIGITTRLLVRFSGGVLHARMRVVVALFFIALFGLLGSLQIPFAGTLAAALAPMGALLVALPCAVIIAHWLATLYRGSIRFTAPMLYAYGFLGLFTVGGASGLFMAVAPVGDHLEGTRFAMAHLHYFVVGGVLTAFLGGLHYWWPKITGRLYPEVFARAVAVMIFVGFNTMFLPQFLLGFRGLPIRVHSYAQEFQVLEVLSSAGATILMASLLLPVGYLTWSFFWGQVMPSEDPETKPASAVRAEKIHP